MENIQNIIKLAEIAFESENYEIAYNYYNKLLESDIENSEFWIRKCICTANLTKLDKLLTKEILLCFKMINNINTNINLNDLFEKIAIILKDKVVEGVLFVKSEIDKDFNALQIPTGTLYAVNEMRKIPIQNKYGNIYREKLFEYFKILDFIARKNPTVTICEKTFVSIEYAVNMSKNFGNFFYKIDEDGENNIFLKRLRDFCKATIEKTNPNNNLTKESNSSGCFIATATMGDYNHPVVKELRGFRDEWLLNRKWGINFTNYYYSHSPKIAKFIEDSILLKKLSFYLIIIPLIFYVKTIKLINIK